MKVCGEGGGGSVFLLLGPREEFPPGFPDDPDLPLRARPGAGGHSYQGMHVSVFERDGSG